MRQIRDDDDNYQDYLDEENESRNPKSPEHYDCDHCKGCEHFTAEDQGIGPYEFGGAPGFDSHWEPMCEHPETKTGNPLEGCPIRDEEENEPAVSGWVNRDEHFGYP